MEKINLFLHQLKESIANESFIKITLSAYKGLEPNLKKVLFKQTLIKGDLVMSATFRYLTNDKVKNFNTKEAIDWIELHLNERLFFNAILFTNEVDLVLETISLQKIKLIERPASIKNKPSLSHDKVKNKLIVGDDKKYLQALKITDKDGVVIKNAQDKFRQINRYVEILKPLIENLKSTTVLKIADMGAGKGYLTFALYDFIANILKQKVEITGVEYRSDLVELCNQIASLSSFEGLKFIKGGIEDYKTDHLDVLIALHACDTATDEAIFKGISNHAELIVVAPCCHKQIRKEMENSKKENPLHFLTKHGIFLERQAEMVTDGLRSLMLEYCGYKTKIFEFVSDVHTPKNIMIVAQKVKREQIKNKAILEEIQAIKAYFGVKNHRLEVLLNLPIN